MEQPGSDCAGAQLRGLILQAKEGFQACDAVTGMANVMETF